MFLSCKMCIRDRDMPVEHMRRYFGERTVASTLDMLDEQDAAIRARIAALRLSLIHISFRRGFARPMPAADSARSSSQCETAHFAKKSGG